MSPRRSAAAAARTRAAVLDETVELASSDGLTAVSIGELASKLGMSKAGVVGPFGSKEALQLAALQRASEIFRREVWDPAADREPGLPRLRAICEAWISYLERDVFPGGCFLTQTGAEFDARPGAVRDALLRTSELWQEVLRREARLARRRGDLPNGADPAQIAFELEAIAQGVNTARQLRSDARAGARGRAAMRRVLGLPKGTRL